MGIDLTGYTDVDARLDLFFSKYPDGSLATDPIEVVTVEGKTFLRARVCAYRNPGDPQPGTGEAWEPFPGTTPYTKNSEAMNAETSARGRAIKAVLAVKGSSQEEVRNRQAEQEYTADPVKTVKWQISDAAARIGLATPDAIKADYLANVGAEISEATLEQLQTYLEQLHEREQAAA